MFLGFNKAFCAMAVTGFCVSCALAVTPATTTKSAAGKTATVAPSPEAIAQAQKDYNDGMSLVKQKKFEAAQKAFEAAAKKDPTKKEYGQSALLFSKVIKIRATLDTQKDPNKWYLWAQSLRQVYLLFGVDEEALAMSEKIHAKYKSVDSAIGLAEVQLKMNKNADAAKVLKEIKSQDATPQVKVLLALALAREGKKDEAKKLIARTAPNDQSGYNLLFQMAQVQALLGNEKQALALLTNAFEKVPPSQAARLKNKARFAREFMALSDKPEFEKALNPPPSTSKPATTAPAKAAKTRHGKTKK